MHLINTTYSHSSGQSVYSRIEDTKSCSHVLHPGVHVAPLSLPSTEENFILPTRFPSLLGRIRLKTELQMSRISTGLHWKGLELLGEWWIHKRRGGNKWAAVWAGLEAEFGSLQEREQRLGATCESYDGRKTGHWILIMESPFDVYWDSSIMIQVLSFLVIRLVFPWINHALRGPQGCLILIY